LKLLIQGNTTIKIDSVWLKGIEIESNIKSIHLDSFMLKPDELPIFEVKFDEITPYVGMYIEILYYQSSDGYK